MAWSLCHTLLKLAYIYWTDSKSALYCLYYYGKTTYFSTDKLQWRLNKIRLVRVSACVCIICYVQSAYFFMYYMKHDKSVQSPQSDIANEYQRVIKMLGINAVVFTCIKDMTAKMNRFKFSSILCTYLIYISECRLPCLFCLWGPTSLSLVHFSQLACCTKSLVVVQQRYLAKFCINSNK